MQQIQHCIDARPTLILQTKTAAFITVHAFSFTGRLVDSVQFPSFGRTPSLYRRYIIIILLSSRLFSILVGPTTVLLSSDCVDSRVDTVHVAMYAESGKA